MTSTLERPPLRRPAPPSAQAGNPLLAGLVGAAWATGAGLVSLGVPVLVAWATDSRSGAGAPAAVRAVGQLWVLAQGAALSTPGGPVGLTPLGLLLLPLLLLHRAGRHGARTASTRRLADGAKVVAALAVPYALGVAVVAAACATEQVRPAPVQALVGGLLVAALGAGSGVAREARLGRVLVARTPSRARRLARGTTAGTGVLVAAGSLLVLASFLQHAGRASSLAAASDPGVAGGIALLATGLALAPNAAVWGASWLAGPGFALGAGTAIGPFSTVLGPVPAVPLLAALPTGPAPIWLGVLLLAVPVAAGAVGGVLVARDLRCGPGRAALEGLALGPCAGLVLGVLGWLSGGPLGAGRLADVGPSPWRVGLAVALETGAAAAAVCAWSRRG